LDLRNTDLSSPRLSLKAFVPEDAKEVFGAVTPRLTRFMSFDPSPSLDAFARVWGAWLPQMAAGTDLFLVVRLRSTGEFLGVAGLHGIGNPEPETGIWIKESVHGSGYGWEAVATVVAWASRECGATAFLYPVVEENRPSRRLAESLGGTVVGARRLRKSAGLEHPEVIYRIPASQMFGEIDAVSDPNKTKA
jgi:RimJ/RimL family protein N-acetyltransferase